MCGEDEDDKAMSEPAIPTCPAAGRSSRSAPLRPRRRTSVGLYTVTPFCHNLDHVFVWDSNDRIMSHRPNRIGTLVGFAMILAAPVIIGAAAPAPSERSASTAPATEFRVGTLQPPALRESSGIVASRRHPGVYWTHNDSGNAAALFAVTREGELIREYPVAAKNQDWEDLAIDDGGRLYIADIGNNDRKREEVQVLVVDEPDPRALVQGRVNPLRVTRTVRVSYADKPFDAESLFILNGHGYVIPKRRNGSVAELFRFGLDEPAHRPAKLERVTDLPGIRAPVTAADVSPDGKQLAVLTVLGPYLIDIDGDVAANAGTGKMTFSRYIDPVMEAACLTPDGLLVTNESRAMFLFRDEHFKPVGR